MARTKSTKITTPFGIVKWASLTKPNDKFNPEGVYDCSVVFDTEDPAVQKMVNIINDAAAAARISESKEDPKKSAAISKYTLSPNLGPDTEEDGTEIPNTVVVKGKLKASGVRKSDGSPWTATVDLFDSLKQPLPKTAQIGRGSEVRMSLELSPFAMPATKTAGISLRLNAVQVKKLVSYGRNAEGYGFDSVEDGFVSVEEETDDAAPAKRAAGAAAPTPKVDDDADATDW